MGGTGDLGRVLEEIAGVNRRNLDIVFNYYIGIMTKAFIFAL